jgi:hypothetical protein
MGARARLRRWTAVLVAAALVACGTVYRAEFKRPAEVARIDKEAPFLKCHMQDGTVYVLQHWRADGTAPDGWVVGSGVHYDVGRALIDRRDYRIAQADVVLFETNDPESLDATGIVVLSIMTAASLVLSVFCLTNPKACFGSCPTFYAFDGEHESLQAEGFSASVARALEATDVDAMWTAHARGGAFDVRMTNDAFETHAIDSVRLLSAPRPPGGRVLRAGDVYYQATSLVRPSSCASESGDCLADVATTDGREYKSGADGEDLATRETIDLRFDAPAGGEHPGLLLVARNSLMNTFLFYQGLAYMGRSAGEWMAELERRGAEGADSMRKLSTLLGGIRVEVETSPGTFEPVGTWDEVGPIALEAQVVPLPRGARHVHLVATRGYWRIEQAALATLGDPVVPVAIAPREVRKRDLPRPDARDALEPGGVHLVSMPEDAWLLRFDLPDGDQELFLESRGYYYEWMRPSWLDEEDPVELGRFALDPEGELRHLAPKFKQMESGMDRIFWGSRLGAERLR